MQALCQLTKGCKAKAGWRLDLCDRRAVLACTHCLLAHLDREEAGEPLRVRQGKLRRGLRLVAPLGEVLD